MELEGSFFDTSDFELTTTKLGQGTFGTVYIVNSLKDGSQYAAKIINPQGLLKARDQMMLIRESEILIGCPVIGVASQDWAIIMEMLKYSNK